jgi:hypothetical protein
MATEIQGSTIMQLLPPHDRSFLLYDLFLDLLINWRVSHD